MLPKGKRCLKALGSCQAKEFSCDVRNALSEVMDGPAQHAVTYSASVSINWL